MFKYPQIHLVLFESGNICWTVRHVLKDTIVFLVEDTSIKIIEYFLKNKVEIFRINKYIKVGLIRSYM